MRLGLNIGYSRSSLGIDLSLVQRADRLGFHSVWSAEAYGSDAVSPLCWIAAQTSRIKVGTAIMQIPARTPSLTATTALTIDQLSGGRFILGLGVSGPQVVEGWHGVAFGKPLAKTREYVDIVRMVWKRERPVEHKGEYYQIPYAGPDATGLGKPLKSILHGRPDIPIYLAAIGPRNVALAAEIADGLLPVFFSPERMSVFTPSLEAGFKAAGGGKSLARFDVAPTVPIVLGPDAEACRAMVKPRLALYVGGMGARGKNFYNELVRRYGYESDAKRIQDLYLGGKKEEAAAAVPDALVDEVALCGPKERIRERLPRWKDSGITTLICGAVQAAMAEHGLDRQVIELEVHARTSQQAADALGVTVGQIVKSLVFTADGRPLLVVASGVNRVDERRLGEVAGGRIRRADPDTVKQATGYSIGGVPPIGLASPLAVYVDQDLLGYELVYAAAGLPECVFPIAPDELVRATGGQVVDVKETAENRQGGPA